MTVYTTLLVSSILTNFHIHLLHDVDTLKNFLYNVFKSSTDTLIKYLFSVLFQAYPYLHYGGPDGEVGAAMRYLSQRYSNTNRKVAGVLTDIGVSVVKLRMKIVPEIRGLRGTSFRQEITS